MIFRGTITLQLFKRHEIIYMHTDEFEVEPLAEPSGPLFKVITSVKPTHYQFERSCESFTGYTTGRIGMVIRPGEQTEPDYD
jgi:hypothetical protein